MNSKDVIHFEISIDKDMLSKVMNTNESRFVPKKPKGNYHSVPHFRCPYCNCEVALYEDSPKYPYCKYCGQALDWRR